MRAKTRSMSVAIADEAYAGKNEMYRVEHIQLAVAPLQPTAQAGELFFRNAAVERESGVGGGNEYLAFAGVDRQAGDFAAVRKEKQQGRRLSAHP